MTPECFDAFQRGYWGAATIVLAVVALVGLVIVVIVRNRPRPRIHDVVERFVQMHDQRVALIRAGEHEAAALLSHEYQDAINALRREIR